jgi:hypothetical protein
MDALEQRLREDLETLADEGPRPAPFSARVRRSLRLRAVRTATASALVVALLAYGGWTGVRAIGRSTSRPATGEACSWSTVPAPSADPTRYETYLVSVAASGPEDALAVGDYNEAREGARAFLELQHWDGQGWATVQPPAIDSYGGLTLTGVAEAAPDDAWAVGFDETEHGGVPLALHWDGSSWGRAPMPDTGEPESHLFAITALAPDDYWAVGGWAKPGDLRGSALVAHWNGTRWEIAEWSSPAAPHPAAETGGPYDILEAVDGSSASDVWAVGESQDVPESQSRTLITRWDGTSWAIVSSPNVDPEPGTGPVDNSLHAVAAIAPDDAWAVGSYQAKGDRIDAPATDRPLAMHWNGDGWDVVTLPDVGQGGLNGVAAVAADDVWAVGQSIVHSAGHYRIPPLILHWDGKVWSSVESPVADGASLNGIAAVPGGGLWAVGSQGSPSRPMVLRCR